MIGDFTNIFSNRRTAINTLLRYGLVCLTVLFSFGSFAAEMEWRPVFTIDFGGNEESDPDMCTTPPDESLVKTNLTFVGELEAPVSGLYYLGKAIEKICATTVMGNVVCLTDNGWLPGGDHTHPETTNKGYFMSFDSPSADEITYANEERNVLIYEKSLPVSCTGVVFQFSSWFTNLRNNAECKVFIRIEDANGNVYQKSDVKDLEQSKTKLVWEQVGPVEFTVTDASITEVYFRIYSYQPRGEGWDFAIDDISVSVKQPKIDLKLSGRKTEEGHLIYRESYNISATYDQGSIDEFFKSSSGIKYKWEFSTDSITWTTKKEDDYSSGAQMAYKISSFSKQNDNGYYRLTMGPSGGMDNNLCTVQKVFRINEDWDYDEVEICKDSTIQYEGKTGKHTLRFDDPSPSIIDGSIKLTIHSISYTTLNKDVETTCRNSAHPDAGDFPIPTPYPTFPDSKIVLTNGKTYKITYDDVNGCPISVQEMVLKVSDEIPQVKDKHICEGDSYRPQDGGSTYEKYNTAGKYNIQFDSMECKYNQIVIVHSPTTSELEIPVCEGNSFEGTPYSTAGSFKISDLKVRNVWGCDSTISRTVVVSKKSVTDLGDEVICEGSGSRLFGGVLYKDPIDADLEEVSVGANGCDSITKLHLTIYPTGSVGPLDTLICRDQILFGKEYTNPGNYTVMFKGTNEYGCPADTTWKIEVVEIQLKLRVAFNQTDVCEGTPLELITQLTPTYADHHWDPEIPNNAIRPTVWPTETTTYTIYADLDLPSDVYGDAAGCHAMETVTINVHPQPVLTIDSIDSEERFVEYTVSGGTLPYTVSVGDKIIGTNYDNTGKLEKQSFGTHTLSIIDSIGCSAETEFSITAKPLEPNTFFSPNGDGENDFWTIGNLDVYPKSHIRVYDRYGRLLYDKRGDDFGEGWDGTYLDQKCPATDYWYEIDVEEIDKQYVGHFTLMR